VTEFINPSTRVATVIPCYKVGAQVCDVIAAIDLSCWRIYVVDDCCPEGSGRLVRERCSDPRVTVLFNEVNGGVGSAVMRGYQQAIEDGASVIVKIDGDGQMDPKLLPQFVAPILSGQADYTKGNRFYDLEHIGRMPRLRIFGNAMLSFMSKLSTGYWDIFDPTNGYTAIHADVARRLPFCKISQRYFFETDMLFRLNTIRAVVADVPMDAFYGVETSNLRVSQIFGEFLYKHLRNFSKRIFYNYFLRDVSIASLELLVGISMLLFGTTFGTYHWIRSVQTDAVTPAGTVMLAALPVLVGLQLILAFFSYDISSVPRRPLHTVLSVRDFRRLHDRRRSGDTPNP
jgi:glycosyltransferase involved in cell wall biosynthesis